MSFIDKTYKCIFGRPLARFLNLQQLLVELHGSLLQLLVCLRQRLADLGGRVVHVHALDAWVLVHALS